MKKYPKSTKQQPEDGGYRKSPWRFVFLAGAVLAGGWLVLYGGLQLLANTLPVTVSSGEAASLGIIGGADGPTAIFVTGAAVRGFDWDVFLMAVILMVGIFGFLRLRKCRKK